MIPWIQIYSNLRTHPKTYELARDLNLKHNYEAVGVVVCLWLWAATNASDGDLSKYPPGAIAEGVGWKKNADAFVEALINAGWLDKGPLRIHDWEEYAALLIAAQDNYKAKTKARVARHRKKKKEESCNANCNVTGNVTETLCNASTRQDQTRQDQTRPNLPLNPPEGEVGDGFRMFWDRYPKKRGAEETWAAWQALIGEAPAILAGLERWLRSESWAKDGGQYIPQPAVFLAERRFTEHPKAAGTAGGRAAGWAEEQTARVQAGTAALGEFEREAIARMLQEYGKEGSGT